MTTKKFDCVEMKRQGAKVLYEQTKNMTREEQLEFWKKGTIELRQKQNQKQNDILKV